MNKTERNQMEILNNKVDLLFSLISNEHLAKQAISVHGAITAELEKDPNNEQLQGVVKKAFDAYKFHAESVNDSVKYYAQIHGDDAQKVLESYLTVDDIESPDSTETAKG